MCIHYVAKTVNFFIFANECKFFLSQYSASSKEIAVLCRKGILAPSFCISYHIGLCKRPKSEKVKIYCKCIIWINRPKSTKVIMPNAVCVWVCVCVYLLHICIKYKSCVCVSLSVEPSNKDTHTHI